MDSKDHARLAKHFQDLNAALADPTFQDVQGAPDIGTELAQLLQLLANRDLLSRYGYFTIDEACERICDAFQSGQLLRVKSFTHCRHEWPYHTLQAHVLCPACRQYRAKTRGFFGRDEFEDVAATALQWLRIKPETIPDWNAACDPESEFPT